MPNQILLDNWTLQEICTIYSKGLLNESTDRLRINQKKDSHKFQKIPYAPIQIEALFNFLQNLILRDEIIVDDKFIGVWTSNNLLNELAKKKIIKVQKFDSDKFIQVRKAIVEELCITSSITKIQKQNEREWQKSQAVTNKLMSQLIWGGAGMLARSHAYDIFYIPHPLRKLAFQQTPILNRDSVRIITEFIRTNQVKLYNSINHSGYFKHTQILLPPLITQIIQESNDELNFIRIALELRKDYEKLRNWLTEYQDAISDENFKRLLKHKKELDSVAKNIESKYMPGKDGNINLSFDLLTLTPNLNIKSPLEKIYNMARNKIGIRSTLNKLILTKPGGNAIKKLVRIFGEKNSNFGKKLFEELQKNYSVK